MYLFWQVLVHINPSPGYNSLHYALDLSVTSTVSRRIFERLYAMKPHKQARMCAVDFKLDSWFTESSGNTVYIASELNGPSVLMCKLSFLTPFSKSLSLPQFQELLARNPCGFPEGQRSRDSNRPPKVAPHQFVCLLLLLSFFLGQGSQLCHYHGPITAHRIAMSKSAKEGWVDFSLSTFCAPQSTLHLSKWRLCIAVVACWCDSYDNGHRIVFLLPSLTTLNYYFVLILRVAATDDLDDDDGRLVERGIYTDYIIVSKETSLSIAGLDHGSSSISENGTECLATKNLNLKIFTWLEFRDITKSTRSK